MQLSDLHVRCLFAAAHSREMVKRSWLLDALTVVSSYDINVEGGGRQTLSIGSSIDVEEAVTEAKYGQVVTINNYWLGIVYYRQNMLLKVGILGKIGEPIYHRLDTFKFPNSLAQELWGNVPFATTVVNQPTTVGRFLENVIVLQYPTDFKVFGYDNSVWKSSGVLKKVTDALSNKVITVPQYKKFIDYFFYLNHISEICVPSMTEKSLMTNPKVAEVKAKFIAEHQDQMHDPIVIKQLEDQLIALDKEYLGDDPSVTFFDGLGSKTYSIHRKKLFLTVGGIPAFDESSGKFDFNPNSLMDGWTPEVIPSIANEIRKGSYERGRETAKGGAETKLVYRVFQDFKIVKDDCGTKRTIKADFKSTFRIADFIGRTIRVGGVDIIITPENMSKYDGQIVDLYSPMTCAEPYNMCYKCCGQRCKELGVTMIGLQTVKITSKFMLTSMKNMHGTVLKTIQTKLEDVLL